MKLRVIMIPLFLCSLMLCAADIAEVIAGVEKDLQAARLELQQRREEIHRAREQEHAALTGIETQLARVQAELAELDLKVPAVELEIASLQQRDRQLQQQMTSAWEMLRENRKECELIFLQAGLADTGFQELDAILEAVDPEPAAYRRAVELLTDSYRTHFRHCSTLRPMQGTVIAPDGSALDGRLLRVGGIGILFTDDLRAGLAAAVPGSEMLHLQPGFLNKRQAAEVRQAFQPAAARIWLTLDISDGRALAQLGRQRTLFQWLQAGGPIIIPLLIVALVALCMVIERIVFLTRLDSNVDRILGQILPLVKLRKYEEALASLQNGNGPVRQVLRAGLEQGRRTRENLEEILQESVLAGLPALERFLGALAVLAAVSPLLGLLGTVSGMISTFEVITVYGTGDARLLSGGISEALITTKVGLIVAVPILLAHAWLNRHVRTVVGHMDRAAISLVSAIREAEQDPANRDRRSGEGG